MKKIILIIAAMLFTLLICIPAYAAETIGGVPGNTDISVRAKYADNTGIIPIPTDKDGSGSMALSDGTEITVCGADNAKGRIVVEEITEKEVLDWIAVQLGDKATRARMYHVYQLDGNGTLRSTDGVRITIKPKNVSADSVYAASDGKAAKLQTASENGRIAFETNGAYFYVLCGDSGNDAPRQTGFPFWAIPIAAAGCAVPVVVVFIKKKKYIKG